MKKLLLGNEAVARGLFEAGVSVVSSYPGTPSTEITEYAAEYSDIYSEWAPNEKVALEVAIGASIAGKRAFSGMKHVGLNVAADPLYTASYTGVNGGLVIAVADDPGMHSSQNEQDTRNHARGAKIPVLEPSDSAECLAFTKMAFELSERFDTPVILRLSTRVSHSRSLCEISDRVEYPGKPYEKNIGKYVMMPAMARPRHEVVEKRTRELIAFAESGTGTEGFEFNINKTEIGGKIGVITSGIAYQYAKEALGEKASYLKLGMTYPLPVELIKKFAASVDNLYVVEELDGFTEAHCKENNINVTGKDIFPLCGEYSQKLVRGKILGENPNFYSFGENIPPRPPVMCAGCPHRGVFYALKRLKVFVSGDIGCYTLGSMAPLQAIDTCVCMGASISGAHGYGKALGVEKGKAAVAVIGDSTFIHSGITGLIDIAYNKGNAVTIILDNSITGMTGHQQNPSTGLTIKNEPTAAVDLEALCRAVGIKNVAVTDPYDIEATYEVIKKEIETEEPSVIIARRACALLKTVRHNKPFKITEKCRNCKACLKIGCPAISSEENNVLIDENQCVGCGQCISLCKFDAISGGENI